MKVRHGLNGSPTHRSAVCLNPLWYVGFLLIRGIWVSPPWLANLTGGSFPTNFYAGDAFGSFNSWMRLTTGLIFGVTLVWAALLHVQSTHSEPVPQTEAAIRASEDRP